MRRKKLNWFTLYGVIICGLIGLGLCIGGCFSARRAIVLRSSGILTTGIVVDYKVTTTNDRDSQGRARTYTSYFPIVRFETKQGQSIQFMGGVGTNPPQYQKGDTVPLLYDPNNPQRVEINSFDALWGEPLIIFLLGGGFLLASVVIFVFFKK